MLLFISCVQFSFHILEGVLLIYFWYEHGRTGMLGLCLVALQQCYSMSLSCGATATLFPLLVWNNTLRKHTDTPKQLGKIFHLFFATDIWGSSVSSYPVLYQL